MARREEVVRLDDLDGTPADEIVTIGLDGTWYEIDLTETHASELRELLAPWVAAAHRAWRDSDRLAGAMRRDPDVEAVRTWGRAHGWKVGDRGPLSARLLDAYQAAQRNA